jgi:alpha-L-fucosidase
MFNMKIFNTALFTLLLSSGVYAQQAPKPYGAIHSKAQLNWHEMEMYCIIHFGVDTYTDKEWGFGDENPSLVNPVRFDAAQIVGAAKAGGFKGVVIVAKHHDGLCLWPTKTTKHNISHTQWKNGKGDMIKEYQLACEKLGMQMGLYCSPWDRNNASYGTAEYINIYREQIKELYSNYGKIFISWHDGANGGDGFYGGKNESRKIDRSSYYDWDTTWAQIRNMQPGAAIFGDAGPDVRWVGNEEGHAGTTSWATYTPEAPDAGMKPANGYVKYWLGVEGTRNGKYWMPAECDVSLRPGWFYHQSQNKQVKSPYTLLDLYYKSVGRGANLDLGLSPNKDGLLEKEDVEALSQFGEILRKTFSLNLVKGAKLSPGNVRGGNLKVFGPQNLLDSDRYSYWSTDDKVTTPTLTLTMSAQKSFNVIRLRENIKLGQRIESFEIDAMLNGVWKSIATGTSIGANKLIRLPQTVRSNKVRLRITGSPVSIALSDFGLFKEPDHLTAPVILRDQNGLVRIQTAAPVSSIHYTLDGTVPGPKSLVYTKAFLMENSAVLRATANIRNQNNEVVTKEFEHSKNHWKLINDTAVQPENISAAIDEKEETIWSSIKPDTSQKFVPASISIDLGKTTAVHAFSYLPRQDKRLDGVVDQYRFAVSNDGVTWKEILSGEFSNIRANPINQVIKLNNAVTTRFIRFTGLRTVKGNGITVAEIGIY